MVKKIVDKNQIDEAMILSLVDSATDYPALSEKEEQPERISKLESTEQQIESEQYLQLFLTKNPVIDRATAHISRPLRDKLHLILQRIGNRQITLTILIDNIVKDHLENHKEVINELCKTNSKIL